MPADRGFAEGRGDAVPPSLEALAESLRAVGCVFAEEEAAAALATFDDPDALDQVVAGRAAGRPLEHLLGRADFAGHRYLVSDGTFVPRRRSLLLARLAVAALPAGPARLLDLCAGVGPIAGYVLAQRPEAHITAVDISASAVALAKRNLPDVRVLHGDLFLPLTHGYSFDVIVASPPYVPTVTIRLLPVEAREHEDRQALDGGPSGLEIAYRIIEGADDFLRRRGTLLVETSAAGGPALAEEMERRGFLARPHSSELLSATVVSGRRHSAISHVRG